MERRLVKHSFLCGDQVSIADLVACCELESLRFIHEGTQLLQKYPRTKAWHTQMVDQNPVVLEATTKSRELAKNLAEQIKEAVRPKL